MDIFEKMLALEPDWDSYGGKTIEPETVERAKKFIEQAKEKGIEIVGIFPTSIGGVIIEWTNGNIETEIEFKPLGEVHYFFEGDCQSDNTAMSILDFIRKAE